MPQVTVILQSCPFRDRLCLLTFATDTLFFKFDFIQIHYKSKLQKLKLFSLNHWLTPFKPSKLTQQMISLNLSCIFLFFKGDTYSIGQSYRKNSSVA